MSLDLDLNQLFDVYKKEIRSILEYAVPVWHSSITMKQSAQIESIQKLAFRIILKEKFTTYRSACNLFHTETLRNRRLKICQRFALKNLNSSNSLFSIAATDPRLRQRKARVQNYKCNTKRFQKSSLPFLANLINSSAI